VRRFRQLRPLGGALNVAYDKPLQRHEVDVAIKRTTHERIAGVRKSGSLKIAEVEYRVLWNEAGQEWNVFRNGAATGVSARKKRKSAVDSAIRDARAEFETSPAVIVVTCLQGRKLETLWRAPSGAATLPS
jgi:PAS domain-containing protein